MSRKLESNKFPNQIIKTVSLCLLASMLFVSSLAIRAEASQADGYIPTTLITGANRGIGFEFAKQYLAKGWRVIATCRKPESADELKKLQEDYPDMLIIDKLDVRDHSQIDLLAERYNDTLIDVLLNNAGISGGQRDQIFGRFDYETYNAVLETNTIGPLKMAEAFYPHVRDSQHKKIITVSSSEGSISNVFKRGGRLFFYRSSKSALNMVMVNLAYMLKDRGIIVAMVNPGATGTDFMASLAAMGFPLRKTEVAVSDMMRNIDALSIENTGAYLNYNGKQVPW